MVAGFHVPVTPLVDVVGNVTAGAPTQYGPKAVNAGVNIGFMVMEIVFTVAH
jgi:hypothetical protein